MIIDQTFGCIELEAFDAEKRDYELLKDYVNALFKDIFSVILFLSLFCYIQPSFCKVKAPVNTQCHNAMYNICKIAFKHFYRSCPNYRNSSEP